MLIVKGIHKYELGLFFRNGELKKVYGEDSYVLLDMFSFARLKVVSAMDYVLQHPQLESIVKSGLLTEDMAIVLNVKDNERAVVRKDERIDMILPPGLFVLLKGFYDIQVEMVDATLARFEHESLELILKTESGSQFLNEFVVEEGHVGLYFQNSVMIEELPPGRYAFWKNVGKVKLFHKDLRTQVEDVSGQEIMSADRVTLRINAIVHYNIVDALKAVVKVADVTQHLYREAQLVLRAVIGTRELEQLLADKDSVIKELREELAVRVSEVGLEVSNFGIKDIILPGEMKELLNQVIQAKKQAEANFISRREETAATRSQMNTAKILEENPTLMRLKELEILEKIALNTNLQVLLGDEGLTQKVMKLL